MPEQFPKKISEKYIIIFSANQSGLYKITITAHCKKSQDLRVEIDSTKLREIPAEEKPQYMNIPPAWNGSQLKGLKKTVVFILKLDKGNHTVIFISNNGATLEEFNKEYITDPQNIQFNLEKQAEDGDRRPWYTFVLIDLPLKSLTADITANWHFLDGDDVKLIIDNTIKKNPHSILHRNWAWSAGILRKIFGRERAEKTFKENLESGVHYIEFWADRTPTIHNVKLDLGSVNLKRIPTVDDPEWTGDFADDTEEMILARLIFGEAENQSKETKIWVAGSVLNRVKAAAWPDTIHGVILQLDQYDPFKPEDTNYPKIINPLNGADKLRTEAWVQSYEVAKGVLSEKIENPTEATHFHGSGISQERFLEKIVPNGRFIRQIDDTYFYWSPN